MIAIQGCDVVLTEHTEKKYTFSVTHPHRRPFHASADTEKLMGIWVKALKDAADSPSSGPVKIDFDEYYDLLELDRDEEHSVQSINRAYRKSALKYHPDKGGDITTVCCVVLCCIAFCPHEHILIHLTV